jgi:hypothetical protein
VLARRGGLVLGLLLLTFNFQLSTAFCQQPTSTSALFEVNSHYLGGRTWADYKASAGAGLTLNIAAGTAICGGLPVKVVYAGGTLTMTNAATNYVYLDPVASCVPASNTTGFTAGVIPLAQVVAAGGAITGVTDVRTWFVDPNTLAPVIRADLMPGADAGAQIVAAIAALPATGGTVDGRRLATGGAIWSNPFASITKPVTLYLGCGTYYTVTLTMPVTPYVVNIIGGGMGCTILQAIYANNPIIKGGPYPTESLRDSFRGFSVKAHASGSTGPAIEMAGFRSSVFEDIEYLSNGTGKFASFFHFASYADGGPSHCYGNLVKHPVIHTQTYGPTTAFLFDNGGTSDPGHQANQNEIQDMWVNGNVDITTIIDARRSAGTKVSGGLAEGNTGAVVLIPGTNTTYESTWMESNATVPVVPATGADGTSNGVKFLNNYISSVFTLTIGSDYHDWEIRGNYPPANLTVVDTGTNNIHDYGGTRKGKATFFAKSPTEFAVRLVPYDDSTPETGILSVTDAAEAVTKATITQGGVYRGLRFRASMGTALAAGDFALSAGWGNTAAVSAVTGTDQGWKITITCGGSGIGANPTVTLTFKDGTWTLAPIAISKMVGGTGTITDLSDAPTATTWVITFNGTPVTAQTYVISGIVMGR